MVSPPPEPASPPTRPTVDAPRLDSYLRRSSTPVTLATLLVVPAMLLEAVPHPAWAGLALFLNWATWLVLAAHVTLLLLLGGLRQGLRAGWLDLILVIVTVPVAPASHHGARLLRLARVFRAGIALTAVVHRSRALLRHQHFHLVGLVAVVAVSLGALAIFAVESGVNPRIGSMGDAAWWAIVTATTVGYGDISPVTTEGRVIAVVLMLLGIGVIGAFTATVASFFVTEDETPDLVAIEARLQRIEGKLDALLAEGGAAPDHRPDPPSDPR